jgi:CheY-like chemotaxis protein
MPERALTQFPDKQRKPVVVLVYDRSILRFLLERSLRKNFRICVFSSTEDALTFARSTRSLDALITDLDIARSALGGCNIARDVRHRFPGALIYVLSATSRNDHRLGFLREIPGIKYLSKPLGALFLGHNLKTALEARSQG